MTPSESLSLEIITNFHAVLKLAGMGWTPEQVSAMHAQISECIQQVADEQSEQSDAQVFGDDLEVTVSELEKCECMNPPGVTVTIAPLFQEPNGNN